ncbi:hypothetical protein R4K55_13915, partial [Brachyspira alvinipulli]
RMDYFEDTWSDSNKIRSLYASDLREELDNIKSETETKFADYLEDLNNKIMSMNDDISSWKDGHINELLSQLEEAKNSISSYLENSEGKKEEILSDILSKIEEKENSIYEKIDSKISDDISKNLEEVHAIIDKAISKYDEEIKNIEQQRTEEGTKLLDDIKSGYDYYSNLIDSTYKDSLSSLSDYTNRIKEEIEKAREESEQKHVANEKNYIDEYLQEYSNKLDEKIAERINILNESKTQLDDMIKDSFNTLNINLNDAILKFNKEADTRISEAVSRLEIEASDKLFDYKEYMSELETHLSSINSKIDNEIYNITSEISDIKNKYKELSADFEESLDIVKSSIFDRDELIELQASEKELLASKIDELKTDFENFKEEVLISNKEDIPTLFEEEKNKIEKAFEDFTNDLLDRVNTSESDINYLKDLLYEDKVSLLEKIDNLKLEVNSVKEDNTMAQLVFDKQSLEDSFNSLKNDFSKLDELETTVYQLRDNIEDAVLGNDTKYGVLSEDIDSLRKNIKYSIDKSLELEDSILKEKEELENKLSSIRENLSNVLGKNNSVEELFKEEVNRLDELFNNFKIGNAEFKDRLEKRMDYFEDTWSDSSKIRSLYAAEMRNELDEIQKETETKFADYLEDLNNKIMLMNADISSWKDGHINELLSQLNEAKKSINNYLETSEGKKEEILSDILSKIEEKENSIYEKIDSKIEDIENRLSDVDSKVSDDMARGLE